MARTIELSDRQVSLISGLAMKELCKLTELLSKETARLDALPDDEIDDVQEEEFWALSGDIKALTKLVAEANGVEYEDELPGLIDAWAEDTKYLSGGFERHPICTHIVRMRRAAIPALMDALDRHPHQAMRALHLITDATPVPEEDRGKVDRMIQAWKKYLTSIPESEK